MFCTQIFFNKEHLIFSVHYYKLLTIIRNCLMGNSTLKILAVVSFIIMLFGILAVYLALQVKTGEAENIILTTQIDSLNQVIQDCK